MFKSFTGWAVMMALTAALGTIPAATASAQGNKNANPLLVPVTGTVAAVGTVTGTLAISRFAIQDGQLVAVGSLTATVTDLAGTVIRTIVRQVSVPVASATSSCDILSLVLGPLHLDVLGLQIDLNQVVLNITAQQGAGNLLGNLLCAITGLLDAGTLDQQLVSLLNQVIAALGAL